MTVKTCIPVLTALLSLPVLGQTTTTTTQQPGTTTTVQTQPPPPPPPQPAPGTQVVVNPPPDSSPPATTRTVVRDEPVIVEEEHRRAPMAIVATDALYGGLAGVLVGGGVALLDDGNHWQRDLMIGAGVGILAGVGVGIAQAVIEANEPPRTRAVADQVVRPVGGRSPGGPALTLRTRW